MRWEILWTGLVWLPWHVLTHSAIDSQRLFPGSPSNMQIRQIWFNMFTFKRYLCTFTHLKLSDGHFSKRLNGIFFLSAFLHFLAFMCMQIMAPNLIKYIWLMSFLYHIVFKKYQVFKLWFQMCNLIYVGCSKSKSCPFQKLSWEFNLMTFQYWDNIWRTHNFIRRTTTNLFGFWGLL